MNHRLLEQLLAGRRQQRQQLEQGPVRKTNADWNFQTNPRHGMSNNYVMQMMNAKMGRVASAQGSFGGKNLMEQKQESIKKQIAQTALSTQKKAGDNDQIDSGGSQRNQSSRLQADDDEKAFLDALLVNRQSNLIVSAPSKLQEAGAAIHQGLIPNRLHKAHTVSDTRVYGGRFTSRGGLYYCSSQSDIALFNTQDPYNWKKISTIEAHDISWTVTDMDVDVNEQYLIYSSISPYVHLVDLETLHGKHERLHFQVQGEADNGWFAGPALMSIKFSGDSREILGGSKGGQILIYDMMQNTVTTVVQEAHDDEINSVCWANRESSNLLFTGSDDCFVKVWDRRALGKNNTPSGVFIGHQEGVTNVASKGDGLYLASNGKDQLLKVWDIRKMNDFETFAKKLKPLRRATNFDYRGQSYPLKNSQTKHSQDRSVFTFKGHGVLSTLIRCQFSPIETTGQRYVYTGSSDGKIHIYDLLTGDTAMTLPQYGPASRRDCNDYYYRNMGRSGCPARDVSWHPHYPVLASTSFDQTVKIWTLQSEQKVTSVPVISQAKQEPRDAEDSEYGDEIEQAAHQPEQNKHEQDKHMQDSNESEDEYYDGMNLYDSPQDEEDDEDGGEDEHVPMGSSDEASGGSRPVSVQDIFQLLINQFSEMDEESSRRRDEDQSGDEDMEDEENEDEDDEDGDGRQKHHLRPRRDEKD